MERRNKIIYWIATGLLSAMMLMNVVMYVVQNEMVTDMFDSLGYPNFIVYPLAIAKLLGIIAILTKRSDLLKEWAYAGFFFVFALAASGHLYVQDGGFVAPLVAAVLLLVSRIFEPRVFGTN